MSIVGWKCVDCGTLSPGKVVECDACGGEVRPHNTRTGAWVSESQIESLVAEEARRVRAEEEKKWKEEEEKERIRKENNRKLIEYAKRVEAKRMKWKKPPSTPSISSYVPPASPTPVPPSPPLPPPTPAPRDLAIARFLGFILFVVVVFVGLINGLTKGTKSPVPHLTATEMAQRMVVAAKTPSYDGEFEEIRNKLVGLNAGKNQLDPETKKNGEKQNRLGEKAMKKRQYYKAWEHFSSAVAQDPDSERYCRNLAMSWVKREDLKKAEEWYLMALINAPDSLDTWREFGRLKIRMYDQEGAIGCFMAMGRISKSESTFVRIIKVKGLTEKERITIEEAIQELKRRGIFIS